MQTHIIYHTVKPGIDCPDGVVAAAIAHRHYLQFGPVSVEGACYRKEYPDDPDIAIPEGTAKIVIVDFSYPSWWLDRWLEQGIEVEVLEHHEDKFGWLEDFSGAVLDENECGATIAWKQYYPGLPLPKILEHVRRRDIGLDGYYQGRSPDSEAFNLGLGSFRHGLKDLPISEKLEEIAEVIFDRYWQYWSKAFKAEGMPKMEERDRLISERLPKSSLKELDGLVCAFYDFTDDPAIAPYYSVFGHKLAEYHGVELAWMIDGRSNHLRSTTDSIKIKSFAAFSLGARLENMDRLDPPKMTNCTILAQAHGGGGHPCASGWQG